MQGMICEHIWHKAGDRMLLRDISLPLQSGKIMCLLGETGGGKTTLLSILLAHTQPHSGRSCAPFPLLAHEGALNSRLTAEENVLRALRVRGAENALTQSRLNRLLALFRMDNLRHVRCACLSRCEKERLSVICAVARRPGLLLLDDPCSMQDLLPPLRELAAESGMMVLYTCREPAYALRFSDTVALLLSGRIVQCDVPEALCAHPATLDAALFLAPSVTFRGTVSGVHKKGDKCVLDADGLELECLCCPAPETGDTMTLCIRSDQLHAAISPLPFGQNISGVVTDVQFSLFEERLNVLLPNGQRITTARHADKAGKWAVGDLLFLCWDLRSAHLYPDAPVI